MDLKEAVSNAPVYKDMLEYKTIYDSQGNAMAQRLEVTINNMVLFAKSNPLKYGVWSRDEATGLLYRDGNIVAGDIDMQMAYSDLLDDITKEGGLDRSLSDGEMLRVIQRMAGENQFNSHQDRLTKAKQWYDEHKGQTVTRHALVVGDDINSHLLEYQFNAKDEEYGRQLRYWMASVARHVFAENDGDFPIDFTLPLVSTTAMGSQAQGIGKTWFVQWLTYNDFAEIDNWGTEAMRQLSQHMFLFDEEAKLFNGRSFEKAKASVTRATFEVRMSYARSSDRRRNRYTIIAANHTRFLDDPTGARRFPIIEIGSVEGRKFDSRSDLTPDLRLAAWGQAVEDYESGWLEENESEIADELRTRGTARRRETEMDEAISLLMHYSNDVKELHEANPSDLVDYVLNGVPRVPETQMGAPYVSAKQARMVLMQASGVSSTQAKKGFVDHPMHYLTEKPGSNAKYQMRFGMGSEKAPEVVWVHPAAIMGVDGNYKIKSEYPK